MDPLSQANGIVSELIHASIQIESCESTTKKTEIISKELLSQENSILRAPIKQSFWGSVCRFFRNIFYSQVTCQYKDVKENLTSIRDILKQANSCTFALNSEDSQQLSTRFSEDGVRACRQFTVSLDNALKAIFPSRNLHGLIVEIQNCLPQEIVPVLHKEKAEALKMMQAACKNFQDVDKIKEIFHGTDKAVRDFEKVAAQQNLTPEQQRAAVEDFKGKLSPIVKNLLEKILQKVESECNDTVRNIDTMEKYKESSQKIWKILNTLGESLPASSTLNGIVQFYKERAAGVCQEVSKNISHAPLFEKAAETSVEALRKKQLQVLKGEVPLDELLELKAQVETELATYDATLNMAKQFKERPVPKLIEDQITGCKKVLGTLKLLSLAIEEKLSDVPEHVKAAHYKALKDASAESRGERHVVDMTNVTSFTSKCPLKGATTQLLSACKTGKISMPGIMAGGALVSLFSGGVLLGGLTLTGAALYTLGAVVVYGTASKTTEKLPGFKHSEVAPILTGVLAVALYAYYTPYFINWLTDAITSTSALKEGIFKAVDSTVNSATAPIVNQAVNATVPGVVKKVAQETCPQLVQQAIHATVPQTTSSVVQSVVPPAVNTALNATLPTVVSNVVGNTVPGAVDATVTDVVTSSVPEVVNFVYDKCLTVGVNSVDCSEIVSKVLTPQIMSTLKEKLTPELISRLSGSLTPELMQELTNILTPNLIKEISGKMTPELMQKLISALTPEMIKSLSHNLTPELVKQLSANITPELIAELKQKLPAELMEKLLPLFLNLKIARTWWKFASDMVIGTSMIAGGGIALPFTGPIGANIAGQGIGKLFGAW